MRDTARDESGPEAPARPDATARTPRYEEIFCALRDRIRGGQYPVGQKLPPELELCAEFDASRHTVREAIRRLTEQGLISRRAGAGTTVLRRSGTGSYTQQISAVPDLLAYARNARLEVLDSRDVKASAAEARLLKCRRGQWWHRLTALKYLTGTRRPVAYVLAYTHRDHLALRAVFDRRGVPLHDFIEARIGQRIAAVEQNFAAKPVKGSEAEALALAPGACGFLIARRYLAEDGTTVLVTSTIFPHDRMNYSMTLRLA